MIGCQYGESTHRAEMQRAVEPILRCGVVWLKGRTSEKEIREERRIMNVLASQNKARKAPMGVGRFPCMRRREDHQGGAEARGRSPESVENIENLLCPG